MPDIEDYLKTIFPEGSDISTEQAEAVQGIRTAFSDLNAKNEKNSKWIHEHLFAKPGEVPKDEPAHEEEDKRPQYEKDYDYYLAHQGDFSHIINPKK